LRTLERATCAPAIANFFTFSLLAPISGFKNGRIVGGSEMIANSRAVITEVSRMGFMSDKYANFTRSYTTIL